MPIAINGSGSITGISAGGLPDGVITTDDLASTVPVAKAWVNFNGTGTVAIRASYNVSSITDNGVGDYTVNFTTALVDVNYASSVYFVDSSGFYGISIGLNFSKTTTAYRLGILAKNNSGTTWNAGAGDFPNIDVSIFR